MTTPSESNEKPCRYVRVWKQLNAEEVKKHILYIDDFYGTCGNCKKLGLNYLADKNCPECKTTFLYLATHAKNVDVSKILNRMQKEGITAQLIEREDFEKSSARDAVKDLFKT